MKYQDHPIAAIFPLLQEAELNELASDIKANGLKEPIWIYEDKILDGRNRFRACALAGVNPETRPYSGDSPTSFVISLNLKRRHLTPTQEATVAVDALPFFEKEAAVRRNATLKKGVKFTCKCGEMFNCKVIHCDRCAHHWAEGETECKQCRSLGADYELPVVAISPQRGKDRSRDKAAKATGASPRYVSDAKAIKAKSPALFEEMKQGTKTISDAKREIKRDEIKTRLETVAASQPQTPTGKFDVLVIDPPWPMKKIERDVRPNQSEFDYPTMELVEIENLSLIRDHAADDCHIFLWTTQKFMPASLKVLDKWGVNYLLTFVWHKPGGFQPIGLPQFNCEFCLYGRIGTPSFADTKAFNTCFQAPRGKHSEKPEEFYEMIRRVSSGRRLDVFNRRKIEGFIGWGKEAA